MDLSKKILLLNHMSKFISEQYSINQSTDNVLGMIKYKSDKYDQKTNSEKSNIRKTYLTNYSLFLNKRVIDFNHFREKEDLKGYSDLQIFNLIH